LLGWSLVAVGLAVLVPAATLLARSDDAPAAVAPPPSLVAPTAAQAPAADPELDAFLAAARNAGERADPLERCLTFPDWPGNAWPEGLAEAHCHQVFDPVPSLAQVTVSLESGDLAGLETRYGELLARHFAGQEPTETLHAALAVFDASAEADAVSAHWLELAPTSAFALAARAEHLRAGAWAAWGSGDETQTQEDRTNAAALADVAIAQYQLALAREPRLLPALTGLADMATLAGRTDVQADAFARAEALDPGCLALAQVHMAALSPRHGGTHEAMAAFARDVQARNPQRPLLALVAALEPIDRGQAMTRHERFGEARTELRPALLSATDPQAFEAAAVAAVRAPVPDHAAALALLVASLRFRDGDATVRDLRTRLLMNAGERTWAMALMDRAPAPVAGPEANLVAHAGVQPTERLAR
jgi:hypothetical protein